MAPTRDWLLDAAKEHGWNTAHPSSPEAPWLILEHQTRQARIWFTPTGRISLFELYLLHYWSPAAKAIPTMRHHKRAQVFFWLLDGSRTDQDGHRIRTGGN